MTEIHTISYDIKRLLDIYTEMNYMSYDELHNEKQTQQDIYNEIIELLKTKIEGGIDDVIYEYNNVLYTAEAIKSAEEQIKLKKEKNNKKQETIKELMRLYLEAIKKEDSYKTRDGLYKISLSSPRYSVEVNDKALLSLPKEYLTEKITISADKTKLKEAILNGAYTAPDGVEIIAKRPLSIK